MKLTLSDKKRIFENSFGKCFYCHKQLCFSNHGKYGRRGAWHVDHKLARSNGGSDEIENLIAACIQCNLEKSDDSSRVFRFAMKAQRLRRRDYAVSGDLNKIVIPLSLLGVAAFTMVYRWLSSFRDEERSADDEMKKKSQNYAFASCILVLVIIVAIVVVKKSHATT